MAQKKEEKTSTKLTREFSAGGVVFRKENDSKERNGSYLWLITKSSPSIEQPKSIWRLPKGWLDDTNEGKSPGPYASGKKKADENLLQKTAVREVGEEGGVEVDVVRKIGTDKYFYKRDGKNIMKFVTYYLMKYIENLSKGFGDETVETKWVSYEDARGLLKHLGERKILGKAFEAIHKEEVLI